MLQVITPPGAKAVTLAYVKRHAQIDFGDMDELLEEYIDSAQRAAETYTRRAFITQTLALALDTWPSDGIRLLRSPIQSITSIVYTDTAGAQQTLDPSQYRLRNALVPSPGGGLSGAEGYVDRAYGITWPAVREQSGAILITYVAGYGENSTFLPADLRRAIAFLVKHWQVNREPVNVGNIVNEVPMTFESLLFPYRLFY